MSRFLLLYCLTTTVALAGDGLPPPVFSGTNGNTPVFTQVPHTQNCFVLTPTRSPSRVSRIFSFDNDVVAFSELIPRLNRRPRIPVLQAHFTADAGLPLAFNFNGSGRHTPAPVNPSLFFSQLAEMGPAHVVGCNNLWQTHFMNNHPNLLYNGALVSRGGSFQPHQLVALGGEGRFLYNGQIVGFQIGVRSAPGTNPVYFMVPPNDLTYAAIAGDTVYMPQRSQNQLFAGLPDDLPNVPAQNSPRVRLNRPMAVGGGLAALNWGMNVTELGVAGGTAATVLDFLPPQMQLGLVATGLTIQALYHAHIQAARANVLNRVRQDQMNEINREILLPTRRVAIPENVSHAITLPGIMNGPPIVITGPNASNISEGLLQNYRNAAQLDPTRARIFLNLIRSTAQQTPD